MTKSNYDRAVELTEKLLQSVTDKDKLGDGDEDRLEILKTLANVLPKIARMKKKNKKPVPAFDRKKDEEIINKYIERKVAERLEQINEENRQREEGNTGNNIT